MGRWYGEAKSRHVNARVIEGEVVNAYDGFNAAPAPLTEAEKVYLGGKMNATVAAIKSALTVARAKVAATPNAVVGTLLQVGAALLSAGALNRFIPTSAPTEVKNNVLAGLNTLERMIDSNLVGKMNDVYSGTLTPDRWFNMAQTYVDGIKSMLQSIQEDSTSNVLDSVWGGIATDTAEFLKRFKQGVERTFDFMPLIVGGVAVIGAFILFDRLVPRGRFSGYSRRRRTKRLKF